MPLSWNEIKSRAAVFSKEWEHDTSEDAEAKSFWDGFFSIFGISRRRVATFEQQVKKLDNVQGFIDLLWKGVILIEHKSRGKDLDKAFTQAKDYFPGLKEKELPRYILVCDFDRFRLYDLDASKQHDFTLKQLKDNVGLFGFIAGYEKKTYKEQDPVNIEAAELMGRLHDKIKAVGYTGHQLELYLVRLVFCLFADDSNIFEKGIFYDYIDLRTTEDGSDLAMHIDTLFNVLNTAPDKRLKNLDENLAAFPYVNGKLFEERLQPASFDTEMRRILLDSCLLDWGKISPAIFGSLFQSVMDEKARRNLGAHYTSEKNILKLIKPLFLDDLWAEFNKVQNNKAQLQKLHDRISSLRFLDPACGCGNFLIIAYRELRLLEIEIIKKLLKLQGYREEVIREAKMDAAYLIKCNVDQFYGIEYEEFPSQIARTAMWLMDHQMNMLVTETFGEYYVRLPLQKAATIVQGNALRIDWQSLIDPLPFEKSDAKYDFILGNPPYIGAKFLNEEQKKDCDIVLHNIDNYGLLDYVSCWFVKATEYLKIHSSNAAFVSTNSITQGEQVSVLWSYLLKNDINISFAHKSFVWSNEAKGNAKVHCVIIGIIKGIASKRVIYYSEKNMETISTTANNINPYLIDFKNILVANRSTPIANIQEITTGNKPIDNGHYIFNDEEKSDFLNEEPNAAQYFKKFIGAQEFINNTHRWILDLRKSNPTELKKLPKVLEKIELVKKYRLSSDSKPTKALARTPTRFHTEFASDEPYIIIPEVSSERRFYLPIGFGDPDVVPSNKLRLIPKATTYTFGILSSVMHNCWIRTVTGRMKSDISYSVKLTYNNFPWPENPTDKQKEAVEKAAQAVLDARTDFPDSSLADLYDPNTMPPVLVKAHQQLDKAVDLCYRPQPFTSETKRIEFLFDLYDKYTAGLFVKEKKKKNEMK